jgi:hypothetical protein
MEKPRVRLTWKGHETVREIVSRLHERRRVLVALPAGFHHTVRVHLRDDHGMHGPVDMVLDEAAFERLAGIRGLAELAGLREPLARAGIGVQVRTPPPHILFFPRDERAFAKSPRAEVAPLHNAA